MHRLIALDIPVDMYPEALLMAWDNEDAVAPIDHRLPKNVQQLHLDAIMPTHILRPDGEIYKMDGGSPVEPADALVMTTSGTTGRAKGVVLTMEALKASAIAATKILQIDPTTDRWLACLPFAHIGGLSVLTKAIFTDTPFTIINGFNVKAVEREATNGCNVVSLVATAMQRIDPSLFKIIVLGGSAPPNVVPNNAVVTYGMTESGSGCVYDGVPLDGVEAAIRTDNSADAESIVTHGTGEILLRGKVLLRCYRDGEDPKDSNGWFATGDMGTVDTEGRLQVTGRISEVINTGGEKVSPEQIEKILHNHSLVHEVAVIGVPDSEWGEKVVACVVPEYPDNPPSLQQLAELVKTALAPWAAPKELRIIDSFPKTSISKIDRKALKTIYTDKI